VGVGLRYCRILKSAERERGGSVCLYTSKVPSGSKSKKPPRAFSSPQTATACSHSPNHSFHRYLNNCTAHNSYSSFISLDCNHGAHLHYDQARWRPTWTHWRNYQKIRTERIQIGCHEAHQPWKGSHGGALRRPRR